MLPDMQVTIRRIGSRARRLLPRTMLVIMAAGVAVAFRPPPASGADTEIVARVNGAPVTRAQFDRMVANPLTLQQARREPGAEEPDRKALEGLALRKLVHLRLLVQEADRRKIFEENALKAYPRLKAALARETETLEQQTATSEVLRVIAESPTDLVSVLGTVAAIS